METLLFSTAPASCEQLLDKPRIYVDLNSGGKVGDTYIVTLNKRGTVADLERYGITLQSGLTLELWSDDGDEEGNPDPLLFQGIVKFDVSWNQWVAVIDWNEFAHASDLRSGHTEVNATMHVQ